MASAIHNSLFRVTKNCFSFNRFASTFPVDSASAKLTTAPTPSTAAADAPTTPSAAFGFDVADLATAKPMSEIPGPKRFPLIGTMYTYKPFPGAKIDFFDNREKGRLWEEMYGPIFRTHLPIFPGCDTIVTLLDPKDFNIVFRNEGNVLDK